MFVTEFFGSVGALVNFIDVLNAAVKTVQTEFHEQTAVQAQHAAPDRFSGGM
jgi:Mg2+/Co2+ transporter CorC